MDEFITKFTSPLKYVPYIREEKAKVQRFNNSFPAYMKARLEFDNPKMMDKSIWKGRICNQQMKLKGDNTKNWGTKKGQWNFTTNKNARVVGSKNINQRTLGETSAKGQQKFRS